jgi:hypothetical protein
LAVTAFWASAAHALDSITSIIILPSNPQNIVTAGRDFTIRVDGTNKFTQHCGLHVFVGNYWTSNPKASPFPVDFVFPKDFTAYPLNAKFIAGSYAVKAVPAQFTLPDNAQIQGCDQLTSTEVHVKPPQSNVGPPPPPPIPKERVYPPPK